MQVKYERNGQAFTLDTASLPQASLDYLLQYGFAQSLQDCIAGLAKAKRAELEETDDFKAGRLSPEAVQDEVDLAVLAKLEERHKAIAEGTVGARVGQPRDEVTSLAREQVKAALAKKGVKVDKDKLAELVAAHVEKSRDKLVAEIARRKAEAVEVEVELDLA